MVGEDGQHRDSESGPPPLFFVANVLGSHHQRWTPLTVAIIPPPCGFEDYEYGCGSSGRRGQQPDDKHDDLPLYLYVRAGAGRREGYLSSGTASASGTAPARAGGRDAKTKTRSLAAPADAKAPAVSAGPSKTTAFSSAGWTKLLVKRITPKAAAQPLASEMRTGLQLSVTDKSALTYGSHGTPRQRSLLPSPCSRLTPRDSSQAVVGGGHSRGGSVSVVSVDAALQPANGSSTEGPVTQSTAAGRQPRDGPALLRQSTSLSASTGGRRSSAQGPGSLSPTPPTRTPKKRPPSLFVSSPAGGVTAGRQPVATLSSGLLTAPPRQSTLAEPPTSRAPCVSSLEELFEVAVHAVTVAEGLSKAEEQALAPLSSAWSTGTPTTRETSTRIGDEGKDTPECRRSESTTAKSPSTSKEHQETSRLQRARRSLFSFLHHKKNTPQRSPTTQTVRADTSAVLGASTRSKTTDLPSRSATTVHSPRNPSHVDAHVAGGSAVLRSPCFPPSGPADFALRLPGDAEFTVFLRWYVWARRVRRHRRRWQLAQEQSRAGHRNSCTYDVDGSDEDNTVDDSSDDDGDAQRALGTHHMSLVVPRAQTSATASDGGSAVKTPVDRRWENFVRREEDPRNGVPFGRTPVYLWHSFLPLSKYVFYACERGFLAVEATSGGESGEGARVMSPVQTAKRVEAPETADWEAPSLDSRGNGGAGHDHPSRQRSWDTVKLIITSPTTAGRGASSHPFAQSGRFGSRQSSDSFDPCNAASAGSHRKDTRPPSLREGPACSGSLTRNASTTPEGNTPSKPLLTPMWAGAQFKDCFLCLSDSHLMFYNSFGEVTAHFSIDHISAVLFPTWRRRSAGGGDPAVDEVDSTDSSKEPISYPFLCVKLKAGADELAEPPFLATFTFLPTVPHQAREVWEQARRKAVTAFAGTGSVARTATAFSSQAGCEPAGSAASASATSGPGSNNPSAERDLYKVRQREEHRALLHRQQQFIETLRKVVPNAAPRNITFGEFVQLAEKAEEAPVHPTMGRLGQVSRGTQTVPFVEIYREDIVADGVGPASCHTDSVPSSLSLTPGQNKLSARQQSSLLSRSTSPRAAINGAGGSATSSHEATPHNRGNVHGLSLDPRPLDGTAATSSLSGPSHILVPLSTQGPTFEAHEQRRLKEVLAQTSSICGDTACERHSSAAALCTACHPDGIYDFDLSVRLASHPVPLLLEKEDLFLPPLPCGSDSFSGHESPGSRSSHNSRLRTERTLPGPGAGSPLRGGDDAQLMFRDMDCSPSSRVRRAASAAAALPPRDAGDGANGGSRRSLSSETSGAYAVVRPQKKASRLRRGRTEQPF